jgi:hypothetical protein
MSKRKPRADGKLLTLPAATQRELADRLDRESQAKVSAWLREAHGVEAGLSTLTDFYQWFHSQRQLEQLASDSSRFREALLELKAAGELNLSEDAVGPVAQAYFEHRAMKAEDPQLFALMKARRQKDRELALREREVAISERKIALLEQQAAQAEAAAKVTADPALTAEQKAARYKEIFGLA